MSVFNTSMLAETEDKVKLLCLKLKPNESLDKIKLKILKGLKKAEKRNVPPSTITHPLQNWTNDVHSIAELNSNNVVKVVSNSRYLVFLLKDGRVCRLRCSSQDHSGKNLTSNVNQVLRRSNTSAPSFQELSDAEYAKQLQAQFDSERRGEGVVEGRAGVGMTGGSSAAAGASAATSSAAYLEQLDLQARELYYLGTIPSPIYERDPEYYRSLAKTLAERSESPLFNDPPPPSYESLSGTPTFSLSGVPPVVRSSLATSEDKRRKLTWPEMGSLEWAVCKQNPDSTSSSTRFVDVATLHSEILLVTSDTRQLLSWYCGDVSSPHTLTVTPHTLTDSLGLSSERVMLLESSDVRVTIVTESGKVSTFYDPLLRETPENGTPSLVQSLTHSAQDFPEMEGDKITQLSISNFISTAVTEHGRVFWWGLCPQLKNHSSDQSSSSDNSTTDARHTSTPSPSTASQSKGAIVDGCLVRLKNGPLCGPNAIVYTRTPNGPRVGQTVNIIEHSRLDPKTSIMVKVFSDARMGLKEGREVRGMTRKGSGAAQGAIDLTPMMVQELEEISARYSTLEIWNLSDVVFLDDSPAVLGRVVTVDQHQTIVDISFSSSETGTMSSISNAKSTLKVFKASDLELCIEKQNQSPLKSDSASSSSTASSSLLMSTSQHVAGVVQHKPVCILSPKPLQSNEIKTLNASPNSIISGYTPLCIHATDDGPHLVVERISDGRAFVVCSGHSSSGAFISTSFVALSTKDSRTNRCTIEEESVLARESGLVSIEEEGESNEGFEGSPCSSVSREAKRERKGKGKSKAVAGQKRKSHPNTGDVFLDSQAQQLPALNRESSNKLSFISCYNSQILLLQDVHGFVRPLANGLSLKPSSTLQTQKPHPQLLQPYNCILSRQYAIGKDKGTDVLVMVLVPKPRYLMPTVQCGNTSKLDSILSTLKFPSSPSKPSPVFNQTIQDTEATLEPNNKKARLDSKEGKESSSSGPSIMAEGESPSGKRCNEKQEEKMTNLEEDLSESKNISKKKLFPSFRPSAVVHSEELHAKEDSVESDSEPVAKRVKFTEPDKLVSPTSSESQVPQNSSQSSETGVNVGGGDATVLKTLSPSSLAGLDFDSEMQVVEDTTDPVRSKLDPKTCLTSSDDDSRLEMTCLTPSVLLEVTVDNSNILHVCCQLEKSTSSTTSKDTNNQSPSKFQSSLRMNTAKEKSFEEMRLDYLLSHKEGSKGSSSHGEGAENGGNVNQRRMEVLEMLLSCEKIRSVVVKLLCTRNSSGNTPFMTAILQRNFPSALKILNFVEQTTSNKTDLFKKAISSPSSYGITPIQAIFVGLSSYYDAKALSLHVSHIPVNFTAQQLLKLFQIRYPSVYKVEVFKKKDDSSNSSSEEEGSSSDDDSVQTTERMQQNEEFMLPFPQSRSYRRLGRNRRPRSVRRGTRNASFYGSTSTGSSLPQSGIIHFSDVTQLRAAVKEMQDFRITSTISSSAAFGQTQSIEYLRLHFGDPLDSDDEDDVPGRQRLLGAHYIDEFTGSLAGLGAASYVSPRAASAKKGLKKQTGRVQLTNAKFSSPSLANELLVKLLSYDDLATAKDDAKETALASIVHNVKCLTALKEFQQSGESDEVDSVSQPSLEARMSAATGTDAASSLGDGNLRTQPQLVQPSAERDVPSSRLPLMPYLSLSDYVDSLSSQLVSGTYSHSSALADYNAMSLSPTLESVLSSTVPDSEKSKSDTSIRSLSLGSDAPPSGPSDVNSPHRRVPEMRNKSSTPSEMITTESLGEASAAEATIPNNAPLGQTLTTTSSSKLVSGGDSCNQEDGMFPEASTQAQTTPSSPPNTDRDNSSPTAFIVSVSRGTRTLDSSRETSASSSSSVFPPSPSKKSSTTHDASIHSDLNMLESLVSHWPSIVTTVLGFYPCGHKTSSSAATASKDVMSDSERKSPSNVSQFSSVHLIDSFVTDLVLNCDDSLIDRLCVTIVEHMNTALSKSNDPTANVNLSILLNEIHLKRISSNPDRLSEHDVALLVGKRFLSAVVRVLALEHSRMKNNILELHQLRQANAVNRASSVGSDRRAGVRSGLVDATESRRIFDQSPGVSVREGASSAVAGQPSSSSPVKKHVLQTVQNIINRFSWLTVHCLTQAADASISPVRMGISKPMGASSVMPEYQNTRVPRVSSYHGTTRVHGENPQDILARNFHTRRAQRRSEEGRSGNHASPLPQGGIILKPLTKETQQNKGGSILHSEQEDSDQDSSDRDTLDLLDERGGLIHVERPSASGVVPNALDDNTTHMIQAIHGGPPPHHPHMSEIFLDLDPTSSDEEDIDFPTLTNHVVLGNHQGVGDMNGDESLDNIYPFAWALDGRRFGEGGGNRNSHSNTAHEYSIFMNPAHETTVPLSSIPSIRFGAGFLARTFSRFVKDLVDIAHSVCDNKSPSPHLVLPPTLTKQLLESSVLTLESTWTWVTKVLDSAERKLQQGQQFDSQRHVISLRSGTGRYTSSSRSYHGARGSRSFVGSTPGEYLTYLLRTHSQEDNDCLPIMDLYGYEHVVYILDSLIYTLTKWPKIATDALMNADSAAAMTSSSSSSLTNEIVTKEGNGTSSMDFEPKAQECENENESKMDTGDSSQTSSKRLEIQSKFFFRTESVIASSEVNDLEIQKSNSQFFSSTSTSDIPHESSEYFGSPKVWGSQNFSQPLQEAYPLAQQPHLLKPYARKQHLFSSCHESSKDSEGREKRDILESGPITLNWSTAQAQKRWHSCIGVFSHIFLAEGPGNERSNFLNARAGFASRMTRFRHQVNLLYDATSVSSREWSGAVTSTAFSIRVRRDHLMQDALELLQQMTRFHYTSIRVKFDGEDGSGPGVNRGFFTSLANDVKSADKAKFPMNTLGLLFSEPGKQPEQTGLYSPCPFIHSITTSSTKNASIMFQRKNTFVAIGRFFGLCLWFHYTIPFMVCRHVAKYLLGRDLAWHDLAFYNADLYEGLRQMMLDAEEGKKDNDEFVATYCCYFEAPLPGHDIEPVLVDLIPGGSKVAVTPQRVHEYVRLYAMFLMVGCVKEELQAMKDGLNDIIPQELLTGLTAEDFQLLLSGGSADVTLSHLKSVIRFNHTHSNTAVVCDRFEKMFWRVVSHMTNTQRQQLLYFATGSSTLPASNDTRNRDSAVAITIDVIGSSDTDSLPVASTCSQRVSIPLYPSYHIMKKKLLQAVQCQAYGLG